MTPILPLITEKLRKQIAADAELCAPREACGLLMTHPDVQALVYMPVPNVAPEGDNSQFKMEPGYWADVEDAGGEVKAVVHSHPFASANPSMADRAMCEASGVPWIIISHPSGHLVELQPSGWRAPLEGREFHFGVLDCYSLVQDWYRTELHIELPDFERTDGFWLRGEHLYRDGLAEAGFEVVATQEPQRGDGLLMRVQSPDVDNHAAVYLGDGMMLHHLYGQLSRVERWDWPWQRRTTAVVRHRSQLQGTAK